MAFKASCINILLLQVSNHDCMDWMICKIQPKKGSVKNRKNTQERT